MAADQGGLSDSGLTLDLDVPLADSALPLDLGTAMSCIAPTGCDPRDPTACADGFACRAGDSGDPTCVAAGLGDEAAACGSGDDCTAGLSCFMTGQNATCARPCCGPQDCDEGEWCADATVANLDPQPGFGRCRPYTMCDVEANGSSVDDGCGTDHACYIVASGRVTDCRPEGLAVTGEACAEQNDCAGGFFCAGFGSDRSCVRICALDVTGSCPGSEGSCQAYAQTPDGTGLCTVEAASRQ